MTLNGFIENAKSIIRNSSKTPQVKNMLIQQINYIVTHYPLGSIQPNISNLLANAGLSSFVKGAGLQIRIFKK